MLNSQTVFPVHTQSVQLCEKGLLADLPVLLKYLPAFEALKSLIDIDNGSAMCGQLSIYNEMSSNSQSYFYAS